MAEENPYAQGVSIAADVAGFYANQSQHNSNKHEARMALSRQLAAQKEFAQNGIRWKIEDARRAGIHPLAALGAQTHSFSPVAVGIDSGPSSGEFISKMGQNISRAMMSTQTQAEKMAEALQLRAIKLDVEGKEIDNALKVQQLNKFGMAAPAFPSTESDNFIPGQGNSGLIKEKPLERTKTLPGYPSQEPGAHPEVGWSMGSDGYLRATPSLDTKERIEDNLFHEAAHFYRNNILPNVGVGPKPPKSALPKGAHYWEWSHSAQGYAPRFERYPWDKAQETSIPERKGPYIQPLTRRYSVKRK